MVLNLVEFGFYCFPSCNMHFYLSFTSLLGTVRFVVALWIIHSWSCFTGNSSSGNLSMKGQNRLMSCALQQEFGGRSRKNFMCPTISSSSKFTPSLPYDPETNYLVQRPRFLHYKPNRKVSQSKDYVSVSTSVAEISVHEPLFTVFPLSTMLMDAEDQGTPRSVLNTTMEHDKPKILSDDEKDEILIKNFMYSLRAPRGTEACMVCKVGGQLLVCRFRSCRRVVHERCIGVAATRSSYCPFCQAISEYSECKKKYCLARKALVALIDQDEYRVRNSSNISRKSDEDTSKESETSSNCIEQNRLESVQNGEAESSRQGGSEQPAIAKLKEVSPQPYPLPLRLRKKRQPWSKDEEEALMKGVMIL